MVWRNQHTPDAARQQNPLHALWRTILGPSDFLQPVTKSRRRRRRAAPVSIKLPVPAQPLRFIPMVDPGEGALDFDLPDSFPISDQRSERRIGMIAHFFSHP